MHSVTQHKLGLSPPVSWEILEKRWVTLYIHAHLPKNITAQNLQPGQAHSLRFSSSGGRDAKTSGTFNVCVTGLKSQSLYQEKIPD